MEAKPEALPAQAASAGGELGFLKIRYKLPGEDVSKLIAVPVAADRESPDIQAVPEDVRFSIAVAAFGQLLRGDPYTGGYSFDHVIALALCHADTIANAHSGLFDFYRSALDEMNTKKRIS